MFITFEGPEGSGKSTQARLLCEQLQKRGYSVILTREPGGTRVGEQIREILQSLDYSEITPETEVLLFNASRAQLTRELVLPHLVRGDIVICDRYVDSTLAYQGYGQGIDIEALKAIAHFATGGLTPDLTVYLDLPAEEGLRRKLISNLPPGPGVENKWDRIEAKDIEFHSRVVAGYRNLIQDDTDRWLPLDAREPIQGLSESILDQVLERLSGKLT
ncbi:MAG: dTMP kinase [Chloroflexi bacterium]|nr:dTMP kinase [Chloroflexota bacterium]